MKIFFLFLAGVIGGIIGGMGMGGGTLTIPILTVFLGVKQHAAQAINLVSFIPMSVVALIIHVKNGLVDKKGLLLLIIPAAAVGLLASFLARAADGELLKRLFGGFLILLSLPIFYEAFKAAKSAKKDGSKPRKNDKTKAEKKNGKSRSKKDM